jgi:hypothetical protein
MNSRVSVRTARSALLLKSAEAMGFMEWLAAMKEDAVTALSMQHDTVVLYRMQGRIAAIQEILDLVDQASTLADKLSRP